MHPNHPKPFSAFLSELFTGKLHRQALELLVRVILAGSLVQVGLQRKQDGALRKTQRGLPLGFESL